MQTRRKEAKQEKHQREKIHMRRHKRTKSQINKCECMALTRAMIMCRIVHFTSSYATIHKPSHKLSQVQLLGVVCVQCAWVGGWTVEGEMPRSNIHTCRLDCIHAFPARRQAPLSWDTGPMGGSHLHRARSWALPWNLTGTAIKVS